ncbi:MAG: PBSX family phage terminase large subunit, partial [Halodesulfurarchaeum sp.]
TQAQPWTDDLFAPGALYGSTDEPKTELSPYRVVVGDDVYDQSAFTSNTTDRYHNFTSGIGAGKTVSGVIRMLANVQAWNPGETGMVITPTSMGIKNVILPELSKWGILKEWTYRGPQSAEPGLHAPNGTRVLLESAENDRKIERLRGPSIAWFWMDEAALIPEKAWRILVGRLRAGEYRNAWITTTPKGRNWIYDKFHPDSDDQLNDVNNVLGVPSYANPHLALDYRRDILGEYSGQFREQEVMGGFVKPEGLVHPWFDRDEHVISSEELPNSYDRFLYGADWGFHPHPAAMYVIGVRDGVYYYLEEHYETRNTIDDLADVILPEEGDGWYHRYGKGPVYCDPSEPANIEKFKRRGINAKKAENDVDPGIQHVTSLADRIRVHESCQAMINEFNQYQYGDDGDPIKKNDHAMDGGLRYPLFSDDNRTDAGAGYAANPFA